MRVAHKFTVLFLDPHEISSSYHKPGDQPVTYKIAVPKYDPKALKHQSNPKNIFPDAKDIPPMKPLTLKQLT